MTQWVKKALDVKVSGPELDPQNPHKRSDTSNNETAGGKLLALWSSLAT